MNKKRIIINAIMICIISGAGAYSYDGEIVSDYTDFSLSNGLEVYLIEDHRQPMIDFIMLFRTGSATDSSRLSGLSALSLTMLMNGTENFPGTALNNAIDSTGGILDFTTLRDGSFIEGTFLSRDFSFALEALADMVQRPVFTEENLEREKRRFESIAMQRNSISSARLRDALYMNNFGREGYGLPAEGRRAGLRRVELDDVKEYFTHNIHPDNAVLFIGGDIKADKAKKTIKKLFADWAPGKDVYRSIVDITLPDTLEIIIYDNPDAPSTDFVIGRPAVPAVSDRAAALILFDYILGGGGEISRLWQSVVVEQALATVIQSRIDWSRHEGVMMISGNASNETAADAIREIMAVIEELREIRVPVSEFEDTKNFFYGNFVGQYETTHSSLSMMATLNRLGVKQDFYPELLKRFDQCDPDKLRDIAREFLNPNNMTVVVSGPIRKLKPGLTGLGNITVIGGGEN